MQKRYLFLQGLFLSLLGGSLLILGVGCGRSASPFSQSAEKALSTFELPPGFRIELIASEPLISDPVDMTIDEEGRMYVVEMHGYPLNLNNTGKVILLTDTNGDGTMDKRTVFADSLMLPTGVMRWKKGLLVTDAPNVFYLEDTTGDGKADIKTKMLTGFALTNPQYLVNRPLYGLDNWIYLAHEGIEETKIYPGKFGDTGSDIFYPGYPNSPHLQANAHGKIVRFRPEAHALEEGSGSTQFGQSFDAWGHHFLVSNANHIYQEVIANRYLKRNPGQLTGDATESISDHGEASEVFPITKNPENQLLTDVGVITSACGILNYLGGAFPKNYNNDIAFVCEPVSNLVHVDRLKSKGASFTASRIFEHKEFLASTDAWFRPVNLYTGPDGALYVVDYYREIIEHPEWMSESAVKSPNLYNGQDMGRIYRITSTGADPVNWTTHLNLNKNSDEQLVERLADRNSWWRLNAQRLLIDRNHRQAVPALIRMTGNARSSLGRLHALWTLQGMHQLSSMLIERALQDQSPGVRENAIKLAELHLGADSSLVPALTALKDDTDAKVRYQLLCTLGSINTPVASGERKELLLKDIDDKWVQIAALSASSSQSAAMLEGVLEKFDPAIPAYAPLVQRLGVMIGSGLDSKTIHSFLNRAIETDGDVQNGWKAPLAEGLAEGLKARKSIPEGLKSAQQLLMTTCLTHPDVVVRKSARNMLKAIGIPPGILSQNMIQQAQEIAANDKLTSEKRAEAINLMSLQNSGRHILFLEGLITPGTPIDIQLAALQTFSTIPDTTVSLYVLKHWPALSPEVREAALNTFITEPFNIPRLTLLLDAIQKGKIQKAGLGWPVTVVLMRDIPDMLKERARKLLSNKDADRKSVIRQYEASLSLKGDQEKGKTVYRANCLICHQVRGKMGISFGPDLGTVQNWMPENIMINILDPNLSISHGYDVWNVLLNDGSSRQGIISSETSNAVILRSQGGGENTIARQDIKSLKKSGESAMPNGFERRIDQQQMADLLAFIRQH